MYNIYLVSFDNDRAVKLLEHNIPFSQVEESESKNIGVFNSYLYNPMDYVITPVEVGTDRDLRYAKQIK